MLATAASHAPFASDHRNDAAPPARRQLNTQRGLQPSREPLTYQKIHHSAPCRILSQDATFQLSNLTISLITSRKQLP